uniref:Uncharacterized protein n=1 Tax=Arundo donax TaxID=35708 RepID=A0A0A8YDV2_ARUDO
MDSRVIDMLLLSKCACWHALMEAGSLQLRRGRARTSNGKAQGSSPWRQGLLQVSY